MIILIIIISLLNIFIFLYIPAYANLNKFNKFIHLDYPKKRIGESTVLTVLTVTINGISMKSMFLEK